MVFILSRSKYTECPVGCVDCVDVKTGKTPCSICGYDEKIVFERYQDKGHYVFTCRIQMKRNSGLSNEEAGFDDAEDWLKAEKGDADSMFRLGYLFTHGTGVPQDDQIAVWWYEKAVNKGCTDALTALGQAYYEGLGVSKDVQHAEQLLLKAFKGFSPTAGYLLGKMEFDKDESEQAMHRASRYFRQSAKLGDPSGQALYARVLYMGAGIDQDKENGMIWLNKSIKNNEGSAWGFLGDLYLGSIEGVDFGEINKEKARECYRKAALKGYLEYQLNLANMLLNAEGGDQNIPEALEWLEKSAGEDHLPSIIEISQFYLTEAYVPRDWEKVKYWAEQGASHNDQECLRILGFYYDKGPKDREGFANYIQQLEKTESWSLLGDVFSGRYDEIEPGYKDLFKAKELYKKAAEQGDASAQCNYANLLMDEEVGEIDYESACYWVKKAAKQDYLPAIQFLVRYYIDDEFEIEDWEQAKPWMEKGAKLNDKDCRNLLVGYYFSNPKDREALSKGTAFFEQSELWLTLGKVFHGLYKDIDTKIKDQDKAYKYYRKAAEQGDAEAQYLFGCIALDEKREPIEQALEWIKKSADQEYIPAYKKLANFYIQGEHITPDWVQAKPWAEKGDAHNDNDCTLLLAFCYLNAPKSNPMQYLHYLKKAGMNGNFHACKVLMYDYEEGVNICKDFSQATYWKRKYKEFKKLNDAKEGNNGIFGKFIGLLRR